MNARAAYNARAELVFAARNRGRTLHEIVAIFRLGTREDARKLEARGRRLHREANPPGGCGFDYAAYPIAPAGPK